MNQLKPRKNINFFYLYKSILFCHMIRSKRRNYCSSSGWRHFQRAQNFTSTYVFTPCCEVSLLQYWFSCLSLLFSAKNNHKKIFILPKLSLIVSLNSQITDDKAGINNFHPSANIWTNSRYPSMVHISIFVISLFHILPPCLRGLWLILPHPCLRKDCVCNKTLKISISSETVSAMLQGMETMTVKVWPPTRLSWSLEYGGSDQLSMLAKYTCPNGNFLRTISSCLNVANMIWTRLASIMQDHRLNAISDLLKRVGDKNIFPEYLERLMELKEILKKRNIKDKWNLISENKI